MIRATSIRRRCCSRRSISPCPFPGRRRADGRTRVPSDNCPRAIPPWTIVGDRRRSHRAASPGRKCARGGRGDDTDSDRGRRAASRHPSPSGIAIDPPPHPHPHPHPPAAAVAHRRSTTAMRRSDTAVQPPPASSSRRAPTPLSVRPRWCRADRRAAAAVRSDAPRRRNDDFLRFVSRAFRGFCQ